MIESHSTLIFKVDIIPGTQEKTYTIELHGCSACAIKAMTKALLHHPTIKAIIKDAVHQANLEAAKHKPNSPNPNMN